MLAFGSRSRGKPCFPTHFRDRDSRERIPVLRKLSAAPFFSKTWGTSRFPTPLHALTEQAHERRTLVPESMDARRARPDSPRLRVRRDLVAWTGLGHGLACVRRRLLALGRSRGRDQPALDRRALDL